MGSTQKMEIKTKLLLILGATTPCLLQPLQEKHGAGCPEGWVDGYPVNIGCLLFDMSQRTHWGTANNHCQFQAGGTLAEVATEIQFDFMRTQLGLLNVEGSNNWWLSGTDVEVGDKLQPCWGLCLVRGRPSDYSQDPKLSGPE